MNEQSQISKKTESSQRTARAVAAILSQTATDEALRGLNQTDGRNQSEQASFLAAESPHLREIYERGGTVVDGVLTVPKENLTAPPEIEITTVRTAVERLTRATGDAAVARELAQQLVEMGERIAGSHPDGATRLKVFGWLYRTLEGRQDLFEPEKDAPNVPNRSEVQFSEKWQQIVELSEALAELEPKDRLPENSLEQSGENFQENEAAIDAGENSAAEIYETAEIDEETERADEIAASGSLVGFERIEISADLPKIPENLTRQDFEKLLEKMSGVDLQLERGAPKREVLAPFKRYVELTRLDNELRLVEEEYAKSQAKIIGSEKGDPQNYRFVAGREEWRELAEDKLTLAALRRQKAKLAENVRTDFNETVDRQKVEQSIDGRNDAHAANNQKGTATNQQKIELTEDEAEFRRLLIKEKSVEREINEISESINERETNFRDFAELAAEQITATRKRELFEQVASLELPVTSLLKEKYPELTVKARNEKLAEANTFEIRTPAEYLFVSEAAKNQFELLRGREIKNEYRRFERAQFAESADVHLLRRSEAEHRDKIQTLKTIEPVFAYKIEGSNRIINAKPLERAVAGYDFAAAYVRYQLKQPEVRLRHESAIYRDYALRLESAKTAQDVIREAYQIRQENHRATGIWKNAEKEELRKLPRPLSKNEMTLLFLEQPPRSYTAEMSVLKYNFAHYSEAKTKMTAALAEGNLQPSADAEKLAQSLEGRLNRRDLETKHKATKHFFESLKTENEKLRLKNEFDHRAVYEKLPPHEKDWIYNRASEQKENLEYKIAYERGKNSDRNIAPPAQGILNNEVVANVRQEFAAGTLWHQAALLTNHNGAKTNERATFDTDEKTLRAVGFLIHNHKDANNLRVAEWLKHQKSDELKKAGEILETFARASRELKNNQLTVTVKINESSRVTAADYKNLFDRFFPADFEKIKEFRAGQNEKFRLERSRRDGQSAMLDAWAENTEKAIYRADAPVKVFENERRELQEIERVERAQIECRRALETKNLIALKIEEKLKKDFAKNSQTVSAEDLRAAVENAFAPKKLETHSSAQKEIFERAQEKISISDFERFSESKERLKKGIAKINQSFERIAGFRLENAEYIIAPEKTNSTDSLQEQYEATRERAEGERMTAVARENFAAKTIDGDDTSVKIVDYISCEERETARIESQREARIALEPAELGEPNQNSEKQTKMLKFADALEDAHQSSLRGALESEIADAFSVAESKREKLEEFLKIENESRSAPENKPATLVIYERELARNERSITRAKISEMIETGRISLADLETKNASEIFSMKERDEIRLEAGERTRENLEPKELWARRGDVSEKLQQSALSASDALERAHEIYHETSSNPKEISQAFAALDAGIVRLKDERRGERATAKFINFKTEFKRDLAQMLGRGQSLDDSRMMAAMTKGLLIDGLEKQNLSPEKIGVSSEKLSEISRTIALATLGDKRGDEFANGSFEPDIKLKTNEFAKNDNSLHRQTEQGKQQVQVNRKQYERAR